MAYIWTPLELSFYLGHCCYILWFRILLGTQSCSWYACSLYLILDQQSAYRVANSHLCAWFQKCVISYFQIQRSTFCGQPTKFIIVLKITIWLRPSDSLWLWNSQIGHFTCQWHFLCPLHIWSYMSSLIFYINFGYTLN